MQNEANRVSLGAVHTRLCVVLYLGKNVVLEIACFSCCLKHIIEKLILMRKSYTKVTNEFKEEIGGVA